MTRQGDDRYRQQGVPQARAEHGDDGDRQQQRGKAEDHVHHPHDDVVQPAAPIGRDGAEEHAAGHGEEDGGEADRQADPRAVDDAAQLVAHVAVDAHDVLRLRDRAAEHVDARRRALAHLLLADQHLLWVVGREDRRGEGDDHHEADQAQADDAGLATQQAMQRGLPERRRAAQEGLLVLLPGEDLRRPLQGGHHVGPALPVIPAGSAGRGTRRTRRPPG
jgi:hypothetical protein